MPRETEEFFRMLFEGILSRICNNFSKGLHMYSGGGCIALFQKSTVTNTIRSSFLPTGSNRPHFSVTRQSSLGNTSAPEEMISSSVDC